MSPETSPRILIVRLTAIGDVVHAAPVLCALRNRFPKSHIAWVVEGRAGDLLEGHPALDELIRVPRRWLKSPRAVRDLRHRLRRAKFDITLDVQGLTKSAIAAWLTGAAADRHARQRRSRTERLAEQRAGRADGRACHRPESRTSPPIGHRAARGRLRPAGNALDAQRRRPHRRRPEAVGPVRGAQPRRGWPSKVWPAARFGEVARRLGASRGLRSLVVWAGDEEYRWAQTIVQNAAGHAALAPDTSLTELASLLRRARLLVAADTGPLHIGAAVGVPCVGLFGPMPHERNGPYGERHIAIQVARLVGTSRQRRQADNATMRAIPVDMVIAACEQILDRDARDAHSDVA